VVRKRQLRSSDDPAAGFAGNELGDVERRAAALKLPSGGNRKQMFPSLAVNANRAVDAARYWFFALSPLLLAAYRILG